MSLFDHHEPIFSNLVPSKRVLQSTIFSCTFLFRNLKKTRRKKQLFIESNYNFDTSDTPFKRY